MQDDQGTRLASEAVEGTVERIALGDGGRAVARSMGFRDRGELDLDADATPLAPLGEAGTDQGPAQPRLEAVGVAERRELPPGSEERLLDGVLREVGVSQDQAGGRIEPVDRGGREHGEGIVIASTRPFHELPFHPTLGRWRGTVSALTGP